MISRQSGEFALLGSLYNVLFVLDSARAATKLPDARRKAAFAAYGETTGLHCPGLLRLSCPVAHVYLKANMPLWPPWLKEAI